MVQESKLKILFLFSLKLAFVVCCCVPDQWEGRLAIKFGEIEDGRLSAGWVRFMSFEYRNILVTNEYKVLPVGTRYLNAVKYNLILSFGKCLLM